MIGEYKNYFGKIEFLCKKCNNKFMLTPDSFKSRKHKCPKCSTESSAMQKARNKAAGNKRNKAEKEFKKKVEEAGYSWGCNC